MRAISCRAASRPSRGQPVVPPALVVGRGAAGDFLDPRVFEHLLDRAVQRAGAQLDLAIAALSDIQHDPVSMEWSVGQRDENLEDRWRHRPLRQQRLRHDPHYIGARIYPQVDTSWCRKSHAAARWFRRSCRPARRVKTACPRASCRPDTIWVTGRALRREVAMT